MRENTENLARILTAEVGKPLAEARGETAYGASFIQWFAEEGGRICGDVIPGHRSTSGSSCLAILCNPVQRQAGKALIRIIWGAKTGRR